MTSKKNNPFYQSVFTRKEPMEQSGQPVESGEPHIEEALQHEAEAIESDINLTKPVVGQSHQKLLDEVEMLRKELTLSEDKVLRALAEIENVRRRSAQDIEKAYKFALEDFAKSLLPVMDGLDKAFENYDPQKNDAVLEGVALTLQLFTKTLLKFGVITVSALHQPFDPTRHEAVSMQPSADFPPNTVLVVLQKGYELNGRLIRPALVIVSA
jgi:molecular chaperone GrpE